MVILVAALALWAVMLTLGVRLWRMANRSVQMTAVRRTVWIVLIGVALLLFCRPHEDIFGGQDTGAYLNGSVAFARAGATHYDDPMLSQVAPSDRSAFTVTKHYRSKYHCLWLPGATAPRMRTWFQPAYPIMAGVLTHVLPLTSVLYVIPCMALLMGLALRALAIRLFKHPWAGETAFMCYILSPLVIWHARYPRPEIIASTLLVGGITLLLNAWRLPRGAGKRDLLLGALCVSLAPFFHMTAGTPLVIVAIMVMAAILTGRDDFLLFVPVAASLSALFFTQIFTVTDTYGLRRFLRPLAGHLPLLVFVSVAALGLLYGLAWQVRRWRETRPQAATHAAPRLATALRLAGAALILVAFLGVAWSAYHTDPDALKQWTTRYFYRTDLRCVADMVSLPVALAGLVGLLSMVWRQGPSSAERRLVLVTLVPASLVIGNMYDFFMTRYMLVALIPLLVLALTSLLTRLPTRTRRAQICSGALVLVVALAGWHHRSVMVHHTQYKGLCRYLSALADEIKKDNGMLLCEYSGIAAPLDLFYGVATLPLDHAHHATYARAETAWRALMRAHPDRPAFFATPFAREPLSRHFIFEPLGERNYRGQRIVAPRWGRPTGVCDWGCGLRLYRMIPRTAGDNTRPDTRFPWRTGFGDGNMGLQECTPPKLVHDGRTPVVMLHPSTPLLIEIPPAGEGARPRQLALVVSAPSPDTPPDLRIAFGPTALPVEWTRLAATGWLCRAVLPQGADRIAVSGQADSGMNAARLVTAQGDVVPLFDAWQSDQAVMAALPAFPIRWMAEDGAVLVPIPSDPSSLLLTLTLMPQEWGTTARLRMRRDRSPEVLSTAVPTRRFIWELWPLARSHPDRPLATIQMESGPTDTAPIGSPATMPVALGHLIVVKSLDPLSP